jgi:hypothetical protein
MPDVTGTFYNSEALIGYGWEWLIGDGASPEVFEAVPFVRRIVPGGMPTAVQDVTHLRSPDAHREKKATISDSDAFTIELQYNPTHESQSNLGGGSGVFATGGILAMKRLKTEKNMILRVPTGSPADDFPFAGVITNYAIGEVTVDGVVMLTVEVTPLRSYAAGLP